MGNTALATTIEIGSDGAGLLARLPPVRGRMAAGVALAPLTWFRVGGPAEVMFRPADPEDLAAFLKACPQDVPVTVLGVASNVLVRDGGIPGVVVRLGRGFAGVTADPDVPGHLHCGAGALDGTVALTAAQMGLGGLEFLSGIPGTLGGAVLTNAGAYGTELADVLVAAEALSRDGTLHHVGAEALGLAYRHAEVPEGWIFTRLNLQAQPEAPAIIQQRIAAIAQSRETSQPLRTRTGGSTFANPMGAKAWALIDAAGCRGLIVGDAMVSEKHCNFLINRGNATAADIEALGEAVRARVLQACGVDLCWEIRRLGTRSRRAANSAI